MKTLNLTTLIAALALATAVLAGDENSHWEKAYPAAGAGVTRHVLHLPALAVESAAKVELIIGKTVETDGVNRVSFGGKIEAESINGWGYTRYNATAGPMVGTLMAPPPGAPKVKQFVTLGGEPYLIRYNSKLPVVVYVPDGFEVRYRIWKAEPDAKTVDQG